MKHRIVTVLVAAPLMIMLTTTPAYAIFGSIIAAIQRAQMIVNQGVQIYNDAMEKITMNGQPNGTDRSILAPERASLGKRRGAHPTLHRS